MKRRQTTKASVLEKLGKLAQSLERFYPECAHHFICPTCLALIDIDLVEVDEDQLVSEAHIIPKAAGGRLTTLLCKPCNNTFGTQQDRWLGEYLRIVRGERTQFDTQEGHFNVDGVRVSGDYKYTKDRGFEFVIWNHKSSPEARKALDAMDRKRPKISITVPVPIDANRDLVSVGFLTAAYLLWFQELGYSWALQEHLDLVRQQIRRPGERLISREFTAPSHEVFERPWLGVGRLADKVVLVAGLADKVVFLPPTGSTDFYESLPAYRAGQTIRIKALRFRLPDALVGGPISVAFEDRLIVTPDICFDASRADIPLIFLPPDGFEPEVLYPITNEMAERLAQRPDARRVKAEAGSRPRGETGRPAPRPI